jgi:hypothetical protein
MQRWLRGLIDLIAGNPTVIVTSHPVKHFSRENMIPRGGGAAECGGEGGITNEDMVLQIEDKRLVIITTTIRFCVSVWLQPV